MCTISGIISRSFLEKDAIKETQYAHLALTAKKGENRGKDGIGVYTDKTGLLKFKPYRSLPKREKGPQAWDPRFTQESQRIFEQELQEFCPSSLQHYLKYKNYPHLIFVHNRAIPESEVQNDNTQPIESENFVVVHNGTIANDKEINERKDYPIDSYALLTLLEQSKKDTFKEKVLESLDKIKGSFAFAIYNKKTGEVMLTINFQSIAFKITENHIYFSTLAEYMHLDDIVADSHIQYLEPYSYLYINPKGAEISKGSIRKEKEYKKGLVMASGGLDTCVVAGILKKDYNCQELTFLHFDYGHKVEKQESEALKKIVEHYGATYKSVTLDFLKELFKDTPLLTGKIDQTGKGMELSLEYVPTRNSTFSLLVASYAEVMDFDYIGFWGNLSESMAYSDTTAIWRRKANQFLEVAIGGGKKVEIIAPLEDLLKHEIVAEGIRVEAPMNLSWSCYQDTTTGKHCGVCASCRLRKIGMERNDLDIEWNKING